MSHGQKSSIHGTRRLKSRQKEEAVKSHFKAITLPHSIYRRKLRRVPIEENNHRVLYIIPPDRVISYHSSHPSMILVFHSISFSCIFSRHHSASGIASLFRSSGGSAGSKQRVRDGIQNCSPVPGPLFFFF